MRKKYDVEKEDVKFTKDVRNNATYNSIFKNHPNLRWMNTKSHNKSYSSKCFLEDNLHNSSFLSSSMYENFEKKFEENIKNRKVK